VIVERRLRMFTTNPCLLNLGESTVNPSIIPICEHCNVDLHENEETPHSSESEETLEHIFVWCKSVPASVHSSLRAEDDAVLSNRSFKLNSHNYPNLSKIPPPKKFSKVPSQPKVNAVNNKCYSNCISVSGNRSALECAGSEVSNH
jgi:hypothetical protein